MKINLFLALVLSVGVLEVFAQEKSKIKFGKITADDFKQAVYSLDSSANAVTNARIVIMAIYPNVSRATELSCVHGRQ